ncbi:MAG: phosphate ABC transporter permease subunit PstC [Bacteroidales bacterium]|jgi:phosphate transport system permease protein|nr:phosphate ABC transporter permease subunit PstC [Bacteroidales bacterium]HNT41514.1 phosphate ABC transporter permease subunit PstC [Tenuifilaceae bacterium]MBP8643787.1 phosphate ABC transporter permease subunit PstC [Bacteroidales bacterium]NLI88535.1 phosphate ABC transporter permease subunit PstC [Bacteroidales bacterium]HOA09972.1 phosphate ABC transporter permease subunit PstC [Tenuifilaceae bacterium]
MFRRIFFDRTTKTWMITTMVIILLMPVIIGVGLYLKSLPLLEHQSLRTLLFTSDWQPSQGKFGFWPFVAGSIYVTLIAFVLSAPVCLLAGIYLTQFASSRLVKVMYPVIDILAGLPSVIYGVWGILVVVPFISKFLAPIFGTTSSGYTIMAGGIVLAVMCVPYMLNMITEVFKTVPMGLREASLSLGATFWESVKHVVIRKSYPGIISAFGLGIAKAFGETMAVMMVVGNRVQVHFNPFEAGYPLPALIANNYGEMLSIPLYDSALMFAALLLLVIILLINLIFRYFIFKTRER